VAAQSPDRGNDTVNIVSSRGPTRGAWTDLYGVRHVDNLIKPDMLAPGNKIVAVAATQASSSAPTYWSGSGITANTYVKSFSDLLAGNQQLVTSGVVSGNWLLGPSSWLGKTGVFMPTATISGWFVSGSGVVMSEGAAATTLTSIASTIMNAFMPASMAASATPAQISDPVLGEP
jgi:hypothetical protein